MSGDETIQQSNQWNLNAVQGGFDVNETMVDNSVLVSVKGQSQVDVQDQSVEVGSLGYTTPAENPRLAKPSSHMPTINMLKRLKDIEAALEGRQSLQDMLTDTKYSQRLKELLEQDPNLDPEQRKTALFNYFAPSNDVDPTVQTSIDKAAQQAADEHIPTSIPLFPDHDTLNAAYAKVVQSVMRNAKDNAELNGETLTDQQVNDLEFALYHPDKASPEIKALLEKLGFKDAIKTQLSASGINFPDDWKVDSSTYDNELNETGDQRFSNAIDAGVDSGKITEAQGKQLKAFYFKPDIANQLPKDLAEIYQGLLKDASATMPQGWTPAPDTKLYLATLNSEFRTQNELALRNYLQSHAQVTANDALLIRAAMNHDTTVNVPQNLQDIANDIMASVLAEVRKNNGLSNVWQPTGEAIASKPPVDYSLNALMNLKDMHTVIASYKHKVPDGPWRIAVNNLMELLDKATSALQQAIYEQEARNAEGKQDLTLAQRESQQLKIDKQAEKVAEQKKAEEDQKQKKNVLDKINIAVQVFTAVVAAVSVAATIVSFGTLGPAAVALIVIMTSVSVADMIPGVNGKVAEYSMNLMATVLQDIVEACGVDSTKSKWAAFAGKMLTLVLLIAATKGGASSQGAVLVGTQYFSSSNLVADPMIAENVDPMTVAIASAAINVGVSIGAMAGCMCMNGGSQQTKQALLRASERWADLASQQTQSTVDRMAKAFCEAMSRFYANSANQMATGNYFRAAVVATRASTSTLQGTAALYDAEIDRMTGNLMEMKKRFEAQDVHLQDVIDALKALITKLQEIINRLIEFLASVGQSYSENVDKNRTPQISV